MGDKMQSGRPLTGMRTQQTPQPPQPQGNPQWYGSTKQPGLYFYSSISIIILL